MKFSNIIIVFTIYYLNCAIALPVVLKNNTIEAIYEAYGYHINPEELGDDFQGDIVLTEDQIIQMKSGLTNPAQLWPQGVLVYKISPGFNQEQLSILQKGMDMITSQTCIRFRQATEADANYVNFQPHVDRCNSLIGMVTGKQDINFADWCFTNGGGYGGSIAHEIIHALGWNHEHTRPDRDDYVFVDFENIQSNRRGNFEIFTGSSTYNVAYDYGSVMHYGLMSTMAIDQHKPVMALKQDYKGVVGQRERLSKYDAQKIQNMYGQICQN